MGPGQSSTLLYTAVQCCSMLYNAVRYLTVHCCTMLYDAVQCCMMLHCTLLYTAIRCCTMLYIAVGCSTVRFCTMQCCNVHYSGVGYITALQRILRLAERFRPQTRIKARDTNEAAWEQRGCGWSQIYITKKNKQTNINSFYIFKKYFFKGTNILTLFRVVYYGLKLWLLMIESSPL